MARSDNKRLVKNTIILYVRMAVMMIVQLYTSRVILQTLGITDYGIYNLVGGIVASLTFLKGTMMTSVQRYLSFELGRKNNERLSVVFETSMTIQLIICAIAIVLAETLGLWFLNTKLVIPPDRLIAANYVYQFSIVSFCLAVINAPYHSAIVAHEKMGAFAYISIGEVILKLIVAFAITIIPFDKLISYGVLILCISFLNRSISAIYCRMNFIECNFRIRLDRALLKDMFGFAGWNVFDSLAVVIRGQGVSFLINMFFGVTVNAARGICNQVVQAVRAFVTNFQTALKPQITKSYAEGDSVHFSELIVRGTKISFFLLFVLALPIILETEIILNLWLVEVPDHTVNFIRIVFIVSLIDSLSSTLNIGNLACGNIKWVKVFTGGMQILIIPICYVLLELGGPVEITLCVAGFFSLINVFVRCYFLSKEAKFSTCHFLKMIVRQILTPATVSIIIPLVLELLMPYGLMRFLIVLMSALISSSMSIFFLGLTKGEQDSFRKIVISKFLRR